MRYLNIFIEMVLVEVLFLLNLEKRPHFWVRFVAAAIVLGAVSFLATVIRGLGPWAWIRSLIPFTCGILFVILCYHLSVIKAVCFGIISYSIQHTAYILHRFMMMEVALPIIADQVIDYVFFIIVLCLYWLIFGRNLRIETVINMRNIRSLLVCTFVLVISYILIIFERELPKIAFIIAGVSTILCNSLALALLFGFSREDALAKEKEEIERVLQREEELHRLSKESIDLINLKSHDLKHRAAMLCMGGNFSEKDRREIEEAVKIYDGFIKTGNDDLDIVIAEKYLRCRESGIKLACIADGRRLNFMSAGDIYSLFGNALSNAVEYLEKVEDQKKRIINLMVHACGDFVSIKIDNYCDTPMRFVDGLPVTSKQDGRFHGFGMKSMQYIVKKYGGTLCCELKNNIFSVYILFSCESDIA